ncbi:MAG: cation:dicarboxylate symporter family transporter [Myxococcota bacterium]
MDVPPEIAQKGIATILAVDWILDRFRTSVNVWGDTIATAIVDKSLVKEDSDDLKN